MCQMLKYLEMAVDRPIEAKTKLWMKNCAWLHQQRLAI